jgi:hypothetical protein
LEDNEHNWITVDYRLSFSIAMLKKDTSRFAHAFLRKKGYLFEPGNKGSYCVPKNKINELIETDSVTYDEIRENRGRLHQERLSFNQQEKDSAPALTIYSKENHSSSSFNICTTEHVKYTSVISYSINSELAEYLTEPDPSGNRTYDECAYHKLRSKYARNLFILFSGSGKKQADGTRKDEFKFKKETLRNYLQINGKYKKIAAFKSRLEQVKKEFAGLGIRFSWRYEYPEGNQKAKKMFFIEVDKGMIKYKSPRVTKKKEDLFNHISAGVRFKLLEKLDIKDAGITNNRGTFAKYIQLTDGNGNRLFEFIDRKIREFNAKGKKPGHQTGWVIGAIKSEVDNMERELEEKKKLYPGYLPNQPETGPDVSEEDAVNDVRSRFPNTS